MKPKYTEKEFNDSKYNDLLKLECYYCGNNFHQLKKLINHELKYCRNRCRYCSQDCLNKHKNEKSKTNIKCTNCNTIVTIYNHQISKSGNNFCSQSCSTTFNNKNKTHGNRRSKLEIFIEKNLNKQYPDLEIHYNRKDAINSELDIYIPSLKLAFELNGILHYEPIYGDTKLKLIQNNDHRKFQACAENGISLCIIDTSQLKYFKEQNAVKYYNHINEILTTII